ncbi:MAG: Crp/Fnr family transcriptional regulator [Candidatus Marinimicrobia bacterium]|nr:Crp/Fnr family transcriptional regulator [Candidatus Neomarinimicrobiota bacterium]MBL7011176.1 Crp/Fnr family transcriptional regulator [Candidatus Neomarinimicrobiota bacterium]MBL7031493.1 Crp/Fnr family transcriptional regulator [Candidatus Neomarinimicrobiota bacterium]
MADKTKLWYLQGINLFQGMDDKSMATMVSRTKMHVAKKREIIYFPEEPSNTIYILKDGKIKISRLSEDGRETTLDLLGPGEIFGESAILGQDTHGNSATVVEDAVICAINKDMFKEIMDMSPQLNLSISKFIGFRLRRIEAHIEDLVFKNAEERIIAFLKRYANTFGKELVDRITVRPFLTHQEIAELTATARQTVNAVLNQLANDETVSYSRRYFNILDKSWLLNS